MKKMKSIMKLCGKLARILVGMARSGEAYNPHKHAFAASSLNISTVSFTKFGLFAGLQRKHGVPDALNKRALTRSVRKTGLHPLDRCNEGMRGHRPVETWE